MKLLVVRIGALGDAIHTLPLVNEIKRLAPETEIHWAAGGGVIRFLGKHHAVRKWVPVGKGIAGFRRAFTEVRNQYDCAIDTQGLMKSAALARAAAPRVIGRGVGFARERPATWLYTELITPRPGHIIEQNLDLLLPLFPTILDHPILYGIPLPPAPSWALLDRNPIIFNIGGGWWTKLWSREQWVRLATMIDETLGIPVGIVWGPGEETEARWIADRSPAAVAPSTSMAELGALMKRSRLVISGETGPLHLAVAVGCRTLALLGPTAAERNGPFGPGHRVIESGVSCRPCHARVCADFRCMPSIREDQVFAAIAEMLT